VLEELQGGAVVRAYTYGLQLVNERQAINGTPTTSFYGFDAGGSVRALLSSAGTVTDTYDYDAFGNLLSSSGTTPNNFRYAGEQFDPDLNLYYNRARYLDAGLGRFWTRDSNEGSAFVPATLHAYMYAGDDPVSNADSTGNGFLSNLGYGRTIHDIIGNDYEGETGGCSDAQLLALAQGSCGMLGVRRGNGRPDLANPATVKGDIFEIKAVGSALKAIEQLAFYVTFLTLADNRPNPPIWHVGSSKEYVPPHSIELNPVTYAFVAQPYLGVILYYVVGPEDAFAASLLTAAATRGVLGRAAAGLANLARPAVGALVRIASSVGSQIAELASQILTAIQTDLLGAGI